MTRARLMTHFRRQASPHWFAGLAACSLAGMALGQSTAVAEATTAPDLAANRAFVDQTTTEFGPRSLPVAEAYVGLANAQRQAGEYDAAAESYLAAVEIYRAVDGPFTPLVIPPLTELGDSYYEASDNIRAVSAYSEARSVSRRVFGLHNPEQIELLDRLSRSLLDMNQLSEADEQQIEALRLVQRSYSPESDEVLAAIYKYAEWLGARSLFQLERDQYARALRIIRMNYGDEDLRQVAPLLGIGNTYRQERNPAGAGLTSLQDALELLLEQPEPNLLATATTLRDLGDWAVAFSKTGTYGGTEYIRAWTLLGEVEGGEALREEWFNEANYVLYEPISPRGLSTDGDAVAGHVIARFDLDTTGTSGNVTIVEAEPAGFKEEAVLRHIRRSRFRPLVANGTLVPGSDLAIQFKFRYLPDAVATASTGEGSR